MLNMSKPQARRASMIVFVYLCIHNMIYILPCTAYLVLSVIITVLYGRVSSLRLARH